MEKSNITTLIHLRDLAIRDRHTLCGLFKGQIVSSVDKVTCPQCLKAIDDIKSMIPVKLSENALRDLLNRAWKDERDFDGFVMIKFPNISRVFNNAMRREDKIKILLKNISCEEIIGNIRRYNPRLFQRVCEEQKLEWTTDRNK